MKKRFLFFCLLCLALVFTMVACSDDEDGAKSAVEVTNDFTFSLNADGNSYTIAKINNKSVTSVSIPTSHNNLPINAIGDKAFYACQNLREVTIPSGIKTVGKEAFGYCTDLFSVTISDGVSSIEDGAFDGCEKLVDVCNLSSLDITAGNDKHGSVAKYALNVYKNAQDKKTVTVNNFVFYEDSDNCYLLGYVGKDNVITLPSDFNGKSYTVYDYAFARLNITGVTVPKGTVLGKGAFFFCQNLETVILESGIESVSESAFECCKSLISIEIPDSVTSIGKRAFFGCDILESVTLSNSLTSIEEYTFASCYALKGIIIPEDVTYIGKNAFSGCIGLTSIVTTDNKDTIENTETPFTGIALPNGLKTIGESAFANCSLISAVTCPSELRTIDKNAFNGCSSLARFTVKGISETHKETNPETNEEIEVTTTTHVLETIGSGAFYNCKKLLSLYIPSSVTEIGENAFFSCILIIITTDHTEKPEGWHENFNPHNFQINWKEA